jgi:hypothetical protein
MLGMGLWVNTGISEEGVILLGSGWGQQRGHTGRYIPHYLGQSWGPPHLCRAGAWSSPSGMVSLVNMLIHEVSGEGHGRGWGHGVGTPTSTASHHCATWGVAWLGGDALGKMRGKTGGLDTTRGFCQTPTDPGISAHPSPEAAALAPNSQLQVLRWSWAELTIEEKAERRGLGSPSTWG